jgi:hypothetical protein
MHRWYNIGCVLITVACALLVTGCAAPLLIASAVPLGGAAAQVGTSSYVNGELRVARHVTMDDAWTATHMALEQLELTIHTERIGERRRYIMARDGNRHPEMKIRLDRRSRVLTKISIRVGMIGDLSVSNQLIHQIDEMLEAMEATDHTTD